MIRIRRKHKMFATSGLSGSSEVRQFSPRWRLNLWQSWRAGEGHVPVEEVAAETLLLSGSAKHWHQFVRPGVGSEFTAPDCGAQLGMAQQPRKSSRAGRVLRREHRHRPVVMFGFLPENRGGSTLPGHSAYVPEPRPE